jgi:hypothetical protein
LQRLREAATVLLALRHARDTQLDPVHRNALLNSYAHQDYCCGGCACASQTSEDHCRDPGFGAGGRLGRGWRRREAGHPTRRWSGFLRRGPPGWTSSRLPPPAPTLRPLQGPLQHTLEVFAVITKIDFHFKNPGTPRETSLGQGWQHVGTQCGVHCGVLQDCNSTCSGKHHGPWSP